MTITTSLPTTTVVPPSPIAPLKPGYLTSEWWSMTLVHAIAALTTVLTLLNVHWSKGLSGAQAAVPIASIAISAALQAAYHNRRAAVKINHTAAVASTFIAAAQAGYTTYAPLVSTAVHTYNATSSTSSPLSRTVGTALSDAEQAISAWHGDMRDVPADLDDAAGSAADDATATGSPADATQAP